MKTIATIFLSCVCNVEIELNSPVMYPGCAARCAAAEVDARGGEGDRSRRGSRMNEGGREGFVDGTSLPRSNEDDEP
jgi:hypothetical protein